MTQSRRSLILRADAVLLALFGVFGLAMDLLGYFAGIGAWKDAFLNNPLAVGAVEAHGLATILAMVLLGQASATDTMRWHWTAIALHGLLAMSNLVFWKAFIDVGLMPLGVVATTYHALCVLANGAALRLPMTGHTVR